MALSKEVKESIVKKYARSEGDTGSAEVQIAILTEEINACPSFFNCHAVRLLSVDFLETFRIA